MLGSRVWGLLGLVLALVGCSSSGESARPSSAAGGGGSGASDAASHDAPHRSSVDCATYLKDTVDNAKTIDFGLVTEPGSWGGLPKGWQALPPGAELCGAVYMTDDAGAAEKGAGSLVSVAILSALYGDDLKAYYDGLL